MRRGGMNRGNRKSLFGSSNGGDDDDDASARRYAAQTEEMLEDDNDSKWDALGDGVKVLLGTAHAIDREVARSLALTGELEDGMGNAQGGLDATLAKLSDVARQASSRHMCYLVLFMVFVFFVFYYMY